MNSDQIKALQETVSVLTQEKKDVENSYYATARELKNVQRNIKELERRNNDLTAELDKSKKATNESVSINKGLVKRIQELRDELLQVKHINQTLMEDNESYQRIIYETTMKGEFMFPLNDSHKHTDVTKKITNGISENALEAELNRADELTSSLLSKCVHKESDHTIIDKLQEEIKSLNDANEDMRLYIEKILNRILEAQGFEEILTECQEKTPTKKVERRKSLSGWHFSSTSQPQNTFKADDVSLPSRKSNDDTLHPPLGDVPKRGLSRNSTTTKRFSIFGWGGGVKEEEKKGDPFMRPMILLQEQERK